MAAGKGVSWVLLLIASFFVVCGPAPAVEKAEALQCTAVGMGDVVLIRAHAEVALSGHETFDVLFEAKPGRTFRAGDKMTVVVDDVAVDRAKLRPIVGGDVAIEMQFDNTGIFGDRTRPFPPGFPDLARGSRVAVEMNSKTILSCQLG